MELFDRYLLLILLASVIFGVFARLGRFCLSGAISDFIKQQNKTRLMGYFVAVAVALILTGIIEYLGMVDLNNTRPAFRSETFYYGRYIIGGFMFGIGMVFSSGCGMRHLIHIGHGSFKSLVIVVAMALSIYFLIKISLFSDWIAPVLLPLNFQFSSVGSQDLASLFLTGFDLNADNTAITRLLFSIVIGFIILYTAFKNKLFEQPKYYISACVIGLVISAGFYISGGEFAQLLIEEADFMDDPPRGLATQSFSFAAPMADSVYALYYAEGKSVITFGVVAVAGLPLGSLMISLIQKQWSFNWFSSFKEFVFNMLGVVLVAVGSISALGCSVGHGLTGISTLALGSFLALASIMLGATVAIKVRFPS